MVLRDYQKQCVDAIWNELGLKPTALACLSTGSGKSVIINELLRRAIEAKSDIKCLVLFNRVTLLAQLAERFEKDLGANRVGVYCGTEGRWENHKSVTVGSIQSLKATDLSYDLIIVDECHNLNEQAGRYIRFIKHQMDANSKTKVVGVTATPYRYDGFIYGPGKLFPHPVYERGLKYFIDKGHLVCPIAKQPDHQIDLSKLRVLKGEYRQDDIDSQTLNKKMAQDQVIDALNRAVGRKKIVWACASISHAELIKEILLQLNELAVTLHSKMEWDDRDVSQNNFQIGQTRHLTFVTVISEGYDQPSIDCIVLMRPTKSPALMVQVAGRGLRPYPGKEDCLILDYANVISTLGPLENPVVQKKGKGKGEQPVNLKSCPECRTYVAPRCMLCPECGYNWPKEDASKLNLTADEDAQFFTKQIKTMEIIDVKISNYTSKNGNETWKITYIPKGFFKDAINEYFAFRTQWGMRKFLLRALDLGLAVTKETSEQTRQPIMKKPVAVDYFLDGKYPRIKRLIHFKNDGAT